MSEWMRKTMRLQLIYILSNEREGSILGLGTMGLGREILVVILIWLLLLPPYWFPMHYIIFPKLVFA